jgi:hypothetical protein
MNEYTPEEEAIFEQGFEEGIEEGIVIEKLRILDLIDQWFNNPDVDYDTFLEWIG